jgi:diguanylate cyclase (GGDEF)-like protein/PAS domain S-box-containing protein
MARRTKKRAPAGKTKRSLLSSLSSDWYWEQDESHRVTRIEAQSGVPLDGELERALLGKTRWEAGIEVEGGWAAHRALLEAREPFRDALMWRQRADGIRFYVSVSGEPVFGARGRFAGYRGLARQVTEQKRVELLLRLQHTITRHLAEATDAAQGISAALRAICEAEGWDCGQFWRVDEAAGVARRFAYWAKADVKAAQDYAAAWGDTALPRGENLVGRVWESGEPLWIADSTQDPRARRTAVAAQTGLRGALLCPVPAGGRVVGVLSFVCRTIRQPEDALLRALTSVATQFGLYLRRADVEAALRQSEEHFRRTFELAGVGVAHIGLDRRFQRVNPRLCHILGYSEHELIGRTGRELSHPDDSDVMNSQRPRLYAGDIEAARGEKRYLRRDGSTVWVAYALAVERDAAGKPLYEIAVYDDISTRQAMEDALRNSEARFRQVVDSANEGILVYDREHDIVAGNAAAARIIGVPLERLIGRPGFTSLFRCLREDGSPLPPEERPTKLTARLGEPITGLVVGLVRDAGRVTWISVNTAFLRRPGETEHYGMVSTLNDITVQKRGERLLRLEHEVARVFAAATDLSQGLKAALSAICESENWEGARYLRVDADANELRFGEAWSVANPDIERYIEASRGMTYAPGQGVVGRVWQSGEPLWIPDLTRDERVARTGLAVETGMRAAFAAPVRSEDRTIGVCIFHSREIREPDERLLQAIGMISAQIGQFLRRMQAEAQLRQSEARFRSLTEMSSDFFWETDAEHRFTSMVHGPEYPERTGRIIGLRIWDLPYVHPDAAGWAAQRALMEAHRPFRDFEFGRLWPDGTLRYFCVNGDPHFAPDGAFLGYLGVGRDVTDIAVARERIATLAYHDALTGLDNRASLAPALDKAVERTRRRATKLAGLFLDLDGFKEVNDRHGHDAGDRLLIEAARRLRAALRSGDPVARLGGDEFFVVLEDIQDAVPAERVAHKLLAELARPYDVGAGRTVQISASIGLSLFPDDAGDGATLITHADAAMYAAKAAGKNAYRFFAARPAANDERAGAEAEPSSR